MLVKNEKNIFSSPFKSKLSKIRQKGKKTRINPSTVLKPVIPNRKKEPRIAKTNIIPAAILFSDFKPGNFVHPYVVFIVNWS